ncbi:nicotinate-nucleotide adenylyltransferase [Arsenicitalea aurantiaca]|uniref:Probable nicotinate-nucleotide adenylyltransferase n=1 Tax=Arsenicitalea aurantiaca TaxID=1783274 RepID=A0A433X7H2_9HYPH|nr:nicotinate-nucleotide adenylyltransferase [Arsenicitalea aurantiaca]RUT30009.1 nicotinate-nucleotide adenylyltransferase [Arsenicitalea aurantiaca]
MTKPPSKADGRQGTFEPDVTALPEAAAGARIGLFGGSFNPFHEGHRLVALQCLERLGLDAVWLLVSPGNPLKDHSDLAPLAERVRAARDAFTEPGIAVTGFEALHGFAYTYDTLAWLVAERPDQRFVWIMGADNLASFTRWERWEEIARLLPIAVYARPGAEDSPERAPAAVSLARYRLPEADAPALVDHDPPAWVYLNGITSPLSSTQLRTRKTR